MKKKTKVNPLKPKDAPEDLQTVREENCPNGQYRTITTKIPLKYLRRHEEHRAQTRSGVCITTQITTTGLILYRGWVSYPLHTFTQPKKQ